MPLEPPCDDHTKPQYLKDITIQLRANGLPVVQLKRLLQSDHGYDFDSLIKYCDDKIKRKTRFRERRNRPNAGNPALTRRLEWVLAQHKAKAGDWRQIVDACIRIAPPELFFG
jgi:hypothetical protein